MSRRFSRAAVSLLLVGGLAGLAGCSESASITVTTTADTVADDGQTSLREAFAEANAHGREATIVLDGDAAYDLTDCADGALDHTSARRLVLRGGGATIRQTCADAGIVSSTVVTASLAIESTTLVGGPNTGVDVVGAAVHARGALSLSDSTVTGVHAGAGGTVIEGGASRAEPDVSISGSVIADSSGEAAVRLRDGAVLLAGVIRGIDGDGVRLLGNSRLVTASASVTDTTGWGIDATVVGDGSLTLDGSHVDRNGLGGISCMGCLTVDVSGTSVSDNGANAAPGSGGGVAFVQSSSGATPRLAVSESTISGNRARRAGGGVFVGAAGSPAPATAVRISGTTVAGNATTGDGLPGGGIAVTTGALQVLDSHIDDNVAGGTGSDGGGLYFRAPFDYRDDRSTFEGNRAGGRGGGAFVETAGTVVTGGAFTGNTAGGQGGGAWVAAPQASVDQARFVSNTAGGQGGGAYVGAATVVRAGQFSANQATEGAGLFVGGAAAQVEQSSFVGNVASVQGGGVATGGGTVDLTNVTLSGNAAPRGGGVSIGPGPAAVTLTHVTATDNSAPVGADVVGDGGALQTFASVLARPLGGGATCAIAPADVTSSGHSFLSDASCAPGADDTVSAADPLLGPLTGGARTLSRAPLPASPLVGTVPVDVCAVPVDQNDATRPQGPACEPGAVEV